MSEKIKTKICSKCKVGKPVGEFHMDSTKKDNHYNICKLCRKINSKCPYVETWQAKNIKLKNLIKKGKKYCPGCGTVKILSEFYKNSNDSSGYRPTCKNCESNKEIAPYGIVWFFIESKLLFGQKLKRCTSCNKIKSITMFNKNSSSLSKLSNHCRDCISADTYKTNNNPTKSKSLFEQLFITDNPRFDNKEYITVKCYFCGKQFRPNYGNICRRIRGVNGSIRGESNFYCSKVCRSKCPTYHFNPYKQIDPRSKLYIPKTEAQKARAAQTDKLKKEQCKEYGYNYCERCGDIIISPDLHHTLPVAEYGMDAVNEDSHLILCPGCHMELHRECA